MVYIIAHTHTICGPIRVFGFLSIFTKHMKPLWYNLFSLGLCMFDNIDGAVLCSNDARALCAHHIYGGIDMRIGDTFVECGYDVRESRFYPFGIAGIFPYMFYFAYMKANFGTIVSIFSYKTLLLIGLSHHMFIDFILYFPFSLKFPSSLTILCGTSRTAHLYRRRVGS